MSTKTTLRLSSRPTQVIGPALRQAIGYLEMSNAALAAALRREADSIPGLTFTGTEQAVADSSLAAHVQDQIGLVTTTARERQIAEVLIAELEPTGWLGASIQDIAKAHAKSNDREVTMRVVRRRLTGGSQFVESRSL